VAKKDDGKKKEKAGKKGGRVSKTFASRTEHKG
jgi:hypothetical protein